MDGIFARRKTNVWNFLLLICGILFVALYTFLSIVDSDSTNELLAFLIVGILLCIFGSFSLFLNHRAYIHIEEDTIHAKYHWFGKLNCSIDEVAFVFPQNQTLTLLLKSGKRHVIAGIANAWPLSSAIRRQIFNLETEAPDSLKKKLDAIHAARKKELFRAIIGIILMFSNIFITVLLTGSREMCGFSKRDWILFASMGIVELLTVIATFYFAVRCGKHLIPIEQLKYRLKGAYVASQPLPSGNAKYIYTDENHSGRIIMYGFPNSESVYYSVQEFVGNFQLKTVHTSEIYESEDALIEEADLYIFIDITEQFQ